MKLKSSDFAAGLFVVIGLVTIIAMFIIVRGQFERTDSYHTYFTNVAGLRPGAAVVYEGYIIGAVEDITPEATDTGMTFRIDLEVSQGWAIPQDSMAEIAALSLLSAQSIQIEAGTGTALAPDSLIPSRPATNLMAELGRTADQFAQIASTSLVPLLETVDDLLQEDAREALAGLTNLTKSVNDGVPQIIETVGRTANNLEQASQSVVSMAGDETKSKVDEALNNVMAAADNINAASLSLKQASTEAGTAVTEVSQSLSESWLRDVDQILGRIDNSAATLEAITKSALASTDAVGAFASGDVQNKIMKLIDDVEIIRANLEVASESVMVATDNAANLSDISEDRIDAFLQKLESAALNIEEMTARLRDDPSIIIRGSN